MSALEMNRMVNQSLKIYDIIRHNKAKIGAHTLNNLTIFQKREGNRSRLGCSKTRRT